MKKISSKDYEKRLKGLWLKLIIERRKGISDARREQLVKTEKGFTTPEIQKKYAIVLGEFNNFTEMMLGEMSEFYESVTRLVNEFNEIKIKRKAFTKLNVVSDLSQKEDNRNRDRQREILSLLSSYREKILLYSENHVHEIEQIYAIEKAKITAYWSGVLRVIKDLDFLNTSEIDLDNNEGLKLYKYNRDRLLETINSISKEGEENYELV